jgi:hypothetical protein
MDTRSLSRSIKRLGATGVSLTLFLATGAPAAAQADLSVGAEVSSASAPGAALVEAGRHCYRLVAPAGSRFAVEVETSGTLAEAQILHGAGAACRGGSGRTLWSATDTTWKRRSLVAGETPVFVQVRSFEAYRIRVRPVTVDLSAAPPSADTRDRQALDALHPPDRAVRLRSRLRFVSECRFGLSAEETETCRFTLGSPRWHLLIGSHAAPCRGFTLTATAGDGSNRTTRGRPDPWPQLLFNMPGSGLGGTGPHVVRISDMEGPGDVCVGALRLYEVADPPGA